MIDSQLTGLLERTAQRTEVGPPPLEAMHARVAHVRRRRTVLVSVAAAVAVVAAAGGTALALRPPGADPAPPPVASVSPGVVTADMRLVGIGHAAIAVPKNWGTNQTHCGTPQKDTAILERDGLFCAMPRPVGVESVDVGRGKPTIFDLTADESIEIDGVPAERRRTTCIEGNVYRARTCAGGVRIPSLDTWFWAESSTNAEEVDRILERIRIVPDRVGVPTFRHAVGSGPGTGAANYAAELRRLGLTPTTRITKSPSYTPGDVLAVSPAPGTMLPLGATVTITVVAP
ncbi:PASTA domain-containing protein [Kribbella turkmenica]|uniref:PASTA domain-containing protein n=1 Tax=Kribbella turkmenica TaxID=2530375 RepID=A0A4R4WR68_9ACTN|nr:PASTA domain-containing protein [Kribbella turkmenica]TDD20323.1 PASTA domain-containing protein [Kribbella turkmenica]